MKINTDLKNKYHILFYKYIYIFLYRPEIDRLAGHMSLFPPRPCLGVSVALRHQQHQKVHVAHGVVTIS